MIGSEDNELFSVYWTDPKGTNHRERDWMTAKEAVALTHSLTTRPAARMGVIREIKIVDQLDFTVFLWRNGEGVIFPSHQALQMAREGVRGDH